MRTTNLLQSYINTNPALAQYNADRAKNTFDIKKELANRTFIKPLPSNGHLVKNSIFDTPSELFKDAKYNLKALKHAINGKANDHELGSLNDLGMKIGGLGIATYLFARNKTPLTKIMEFVGLTTFFGTMDIWPKLALQLPASLIHGFNIRQQYRDNTGTKKPVFQDHQFIPWDLYSDQEINRIGDRMGVPKDIKNRRDFIQEKMRKIALQNNTLWMLTAGFATPIMSALLCNAMEKPIANRQDRMLEKETEELIESFPKKWEKYKDSEYIESVGKVLEKYKDKPITPEVLKNITETISQGLDPLTTQSIEKDIDSILISDGFNFSKESLTKIQETLIKGFEGTEIPAKDIENVIPSTQELYEAFSNKNLLSQDNVRESVTDFTEHVKTLYKLINKKIQTYGEQSGNSEVAEEMQYMMDNLLHSKNGKTPEIYKVLTSIPTSKLSDEAIQNLKQITKVLNDYKAKVHIIDQYAYLKAGQARETLLANTWNNITSDFLRIFGFSKEEITKVRFDREIAGDLLREKLEKITSNDELYEKVLQEINQKLNYLDARTEFADIEKSNKEQSHKYKKAVDSTFDHASSELDKLKMHSTARRLTGSYEGDPRTIKDMKLSFMIDRAKGVRSSFYRILSALDTYKKISDLKNIDHILDPSITREGKEALVEMCKEIMIKGHSSDFAIKFYFPVKAFEHIDFHNNEEARKEFYSQIEVKDGKVVNKYFRKDPNAQYVDNAYDRKFYEKAMRLMFDDQLHPETRRIIGDSPFFNKFMQYRQDVIDFIGGDEYFAKKLHKVANAKGGGSSELRFLLLGATPDEIFKNLCSQKHNSNKWLKIFGLSGAGLLALTTISQFFMGRMKNINEQHKTNNIEKGESK